MPKPSKELMMTRNQFYDLMAQRLPRCLEILDDHLGSLSLRAEQRWAVQTIFEKLLPSLVAMPKEQESLADSLRSILKNKKEICEEGPVMDDGAVDARVVPEGEMKFKDLKPMEVTDGTQVNPQ